MKASSCLCIFHTTITCLKESVDHCVKALFGNLSETLNYGFSDKVKHKQRKLDKPNLNQTQDLSGF